MTREKVVSLLDIGHDIFSGFVFEHFQCISITIIVKKCLTFHRVQQRTHKDDMDEMNSLMMITFPPPHGSVKLIDLDGISPLHLIFNS